MSIESADKIQLHNEESQVQFRALIYIVDSKFLYETNVDAWSFQQVSLKTLLSFSREVLTAVLHLAFSSYKSES